MSNRQPNPSPITVRRQQELQALLDGWREAGETIALVPTMGALHEGHLTLVCEARQHCRRVIVSIFVNPAQFGPNEDFDRYPRQTEADLALLASVQADAAWLPSVEDIYPEGFATHVTVGALGNVLCGAHRPGHFDGVATVVSILLNSVRPDQALFGEKDYQQLSIIRRMATDLRLPGHIRGVATVREEDGLAMSSRNRYLSPAERELAPLLYRALRDAKARIVAGEPLEQVLNAARKRLSEQGFALDYLEARDSKLAMMDEYRPGGRLFVAARLGNTRLIDNFSLDETDE